MNNFSWEEYDKNIVYNTNDYTHAYSQYSIPSGSLTGSQRLSQELRCDYFLDTVLFEPAVIKRTGGDYIDVTSSVKTKPKLKEYTMTCQYLYNKCR